MDVVEDGQIIGGAKKGLPEQVNTHTPHAQMMCMYLPTLTRHPTVPPSQNISTTPTHHNHTASPPQTSLRWIDPPRNVLLLMKRGSGEILQRVADITNFLQAREGVRVLVERQVSQWVIIRVWGAGQGFFCGGQWACGV